MGCSWTTICTAAWRPGCESGARGTPVPGGSWSRRSTRAEVPSPSPEILEAGPDLAQSSTYRNLSELIELGVVERVVTSDEHSRYELTEAVTGHHHHHLVCSTCGAVTDVAVPDDVERSLDTSVRVLAAEHGFDLDHHRLDLVGTCGGCR